MTVVALTHGYPPEWNMGGEVALHRAMRVLAGPRHVLTNTQAPYVVDDIAVSRLNVPRFTDTQVDWVPVARQLEALGATLVIAQNELSLPAVRAARMLGIPSVVYVHTPVKYGSSTCEAIPLADYVVYNTATSAAEWGEPDALVLHPSTGTLPPKPAELPAGDTYTLLSSLGHKGVDTVLTVARQMPDRQFLIVESPAVAMEPHNLRAQIAKLDNVTLEPRVPPEEVYDRYLSRTRILLVPGRYETYGMSAIEAAGHGIPSVHVDTPHVREGIGTAAVLIPGLNPRALQLGIETIEKSYFGWSLNARNRADALAVREALEFERWAGFIASEPAPLTAEEQAKRQARLQKPGRDASPARARGELLLERQRAQREAAEAHRQLIRARRARVMHPVDKPVDNPRDPRPLGRP